MAGTAIEVQWILSQCTYCDARVTGMNVGMPHTTVRSIQFANSIGTGLVVTKMLQLTCSPAQ